MKRVSNLYDSITKIENIMSVYDCMKHNIKNKKNVLMFEEYYTANINNIRNILINKNYHNIKYNIFLIKEPKYRIVMSQNVSDKLINHLIAKYFLADVLEKSLIDTNVATRVNKGTSYGIKKLKEFLVKMINKNKTIYALKFDIKKYFYRIDHEIVMELLNNKIKDKDALNIIKSIIDSTDMPYVNESIKRLKDNEIKRVSQLNLPIKEKERKIKEIEKIPFYEKGKGLPIGNMSSQILAIFFMNELDHYIKEKLHCTYYIRYMDDGLILSDNKEYLKMCLNEIKVIISKYKLELNNKTTIVNILKNGINFLGFHFYIKNKKILMKVSNVTKKRFKKKMRKFDLQVTNSYRGHFKYGNCHNLFLKYTKIG